MSDQENSNNNAQESDSTSQNVLNSIAQRTLDNLIVAIDNETNNSDPTPTTTNETQPNETLINKLKSKIQTLKNLSAIKQDLLNIRQKDCKDFIAKIKLFEEALNHEKTLRLELHERVDSAEASCSDLTERLKNNVALLDNVKSKYENKIVGLIADLEKSNYECNQSKTIIAEHESRIVELEKRIVELEVENAEANNKLTQASEPTVQKQEIFEIKSEYENKIVELIADLETSNYECNQSKTIIAELEKRIAELELENDEVNNKLTQLSESTTKATADKQDNVGAGITIDKKEPDLVASNEYDAGTPTTIQNLKSQLEEATERNRVLAYQMALLNTLFTETEQTSIDFDRIRAIGDIFRESLEQNQVTENETNNENCTIDDTQLSTLLAQQDAEHLNMNTDEEVSGGSRKQSFDVTRIIEKLDASNERKIEEIPGEESCYKSIATTAGPKLVLSVSRTFIKLKDLILEKKSLQKEIDGLKELNDKLSVKVDQQERRLYCVRGELNKTWSLVATLKAQHKQLHNSKAVIRYELQEKRKLLEKLKRDLSLSREKWIRVRQKNSESEIEWLKIREEFARRRTEDASQSQESGAFFSEEGQQAPMLSTSPSTISNDDGDGDGEDENDGDVEEEGVVMKPVDTVELSKIKKSPILLKKSEKLLLERQHKQEQGSSNNGAAAAGACGSTEVHHQPLEAFGMDYVKAEFDDPLDELEDLAEEIKTIEAAAAATSDDDDDDDDNEDNDDAGIFHGSEVNWERLVNHRAARLQALEEQCRLLYNKLSSSKVKSITLSTKLAHLHNCYRSDSDDATTDQSHPTETSDDTAYASGFGGRSHHLGRGIGNENNVDVDLDTTEILSSEMESQDEQDNNHVVAAASVGEGPSNGIIKSIDRTTPVTSSSSSKNLLKEQSINSNECKTIVGSHSSRSSNNNNTNKDNKLNINSREESRNNNNSNSLVQIASENRELQEEETVGQSTISRENATIIITDETIEQIASRQNHLIVRNGDVLPPLLLMPTSQNPNHHHHHVMNEFNQNLASTNTNNPLVSFANQNNHILDEDEPMNSIPLNSQSPIRSNNDSTNSSINESSGISSSKYTNTPSDVDDNDNEEKDNSSNRSPSDLSSLGRLIIQQLPKRLDILKHENKALMEEVVLADKILKKTEEELQNEKRLSCLLQKQIEQQNLIEVKLQEELELQQQIIQELKNEIGNGKICFENLMSEKQKLSNFVQICLEDQQIQDQRQNIKSLEHKSCGLCQSKFTFFKKKHNCKICGYDFCNKCSSERKLAAIDSTNCTITNSEGTTSTGETSRQNSKGHVCTTCHQRKEKIETLKSEIVV